MVKSGDLLCVEVLARILVGTDGGFSQARPCKDWYDSARQASGPACRFAADASALPSPLCQRRATLYQSATCSGFLCPPVLSAVPRYAWRYLRRPRVRSRAVQGHLSLALLVGVARRAALPHDPVELPSTADRNIGVWHPPRRVVPALAGPKCRLAVGTRLAVINDLGDGPGVNRTKPSGSGMLAKSSCAG